MDELNMKQPAPMMGKPKPELPAHHVSKSLKVLMLVFAVMLVGGLGYLVWYQNTTSDTTEETTVTTKKTTGTTTASAETASWETYTNTSPAFTIKYPTGWTATAGTTTPGIAYGKTAVFVKDLLDVEMADYSMDITATSSSLSASAYIDKLKTDASAEIALGHPAIAYKTATAVKIGGLDGYKMVGVTSMAKVTNQYYVKSGNYIYLIEILTNPGEGTPYDTAPYVTLAEKALGTLTFTN